MTTRPVSPVLLPRHSAAEPVAPSPRLVPESVAPSRRSAAEPVAPSPRSVAEPVLPSACVAADAAFRAVLDAAARAEEWDAPTRQGVLAWLARHRDMVAAVEARVLTAEREAGTWSLRGDRDLAGFVGRQTRAGRGAGMAAVAQAGTLAAMPAVADALVDGPVTATHVAAITRATQQSPALAAELATPAGQKQVVGLAGRLDGSDFGKALAQMSAALDPATRQRTHDEHRAERSFAWTHTRAGTLVKGRLDTVAGHKFTKAIEALCPRPSVDDERTREQRQADALVAMAELVATDKRTTPGAVAPIQAVLTMSQETWAALRAVQDDGVAAPGSARGLIERLRGMEPVTDETGQAWPASEIARALCDCALTRAVVGSKDAELNLGRQSRAFTRQHWLALYAAGITSCAIEGCGMPLAYCELHHVRWWYEHGGLTEMANCLPYCSFHHHEIHRNGIVVDRLPDGRAAHHHADGRPYGGRLPDGLPATSRDNARPAAETPRDYRPEPAARPDNGPPGAAPQGEGSAGAPTPDDGPRSATPLAEERSAAQATGVPVGGRARELMRPPEDPPGDLLQLLSA